MSGEVDALLDRQEDIEARQIASLHVSEKLFEWTRHESLGIVEPCRGSCLSTRSMASILSRVVLIDGDREVGCAERTLRQELEDVDDDGVVEDARLPRVRLLRARPGQAVHHFQSTQKVDVGDALAFRVVAGFDV